ncbi:PAS domain S-box protein [Draconibacterium sp.]|uniref:hybrid sensor histidine kinase/response regulator n=1 Tax=Draconibacterium sp. TaxID=1965318 RepID=UPI003561BC5E
MINKADQKIAHLHKIIESTREIVRLIVSEKNPAQLAKNTCRILVNTRGYYYAWILLLDDLQKADSFAGFGDPEIVDNVKKQLLQNGVPDQLLQTISQLNDAVTRNIPSSLLIAPDSNKWIPILTPLKDNERLYGILCAGIPIKDYSHPKEKQTFIEIAADVGFALSKIQQEKVSKNTQIRYKNLVNSLNDGLLILQDGVIKFVNKSLCETTGYSEDELLDKEFTMLVAPEELDKVKQLYTELLSVNAVQKKYDSAAITKSGRSFSVEITPVDTIFDNRPAFMIILHDNSELKYTLEQLKEREAYFRFLSESAFEGIIVHDNGIILDVNATLLRITGYSRKEMIGKNLLTDFFQEKDQNKIRRKINSPVVKPFVLSAFKKDGTYGYVEVEARSIVYKGKKARIAAVRDISERYRLQNEIKKEQDKQNRLLDDLPGVAYNCKNNERWSMNFISKGSYALLGYKPEELIEGGSIDFYSLIHPDDIKHIQEAIRNAIDQNKSFEIEYRIFNKQKQEKWVWERGKAVYHNDEILLEGFISDITRRKKLAKSNEMLSKAIESSPVSIIITGIEGHIEYVNSCFETVTGYKKEEVLGKKPAILKSGLQDSKIYKQMWATIKAGGIWQGELVNKKKSGEFFWEHVNISPIYNETGLIEQFISVRENITEKKQTLKELQKAKETAEQNERRFKALHNASFGGITIHDKGLILDCNQGLSNITGYSHEELLGMDGMKLIAADQREIVMKKILSEYDKPYETVGLRKNGQTYPLRIQGKMIPYNNKLVRVTEFRDITEQKEIEKELVRAKENAEQSDKLKSSFLANMSHEIRTPMNGILGFTELLRDQELSLQQRTEFIDVIQNSGERMLNTINDIIDISKIESGMVIAHMQDINLPALIKELYIFFEQSMKLKGITFKLNENNGNPVMLLHTDPDKLNSILTNLIRNAYKFTSSGTIEFGYTTSKNHINFFVKDTGVGIPQERQQAIFERFVQADIADSRVFEGSGLGLAITKSYTEMLNGTISLESEVGKGTTFYVSLPMQATINSQQTTPSELQLIDNVLQQNKLKILIAEDDTISIELLKLLVRDIASEILVANNGKKAVEMARNTPDLNLILMDIKMPVIDGYTATKMIREFNTSVKIIAQSAFAQTEDIKKANSAGCDDFISKPINRKLLIETINELFLNDL